MKNKISLIFLGLILSITLFSFRPSPDSINFNQLIFERFTEHLNNSLQEKIYLQTDKPYYSAGEKIWFRGYLVNAATNTPISISNFLMVELVNKSDSVLLRSKIRKDSYGFTGNLDLKPELPSGYYAIRAYTSWMQNGSPDFFFSKTIFIGNPIDDRVLCNISYGTKTSGKVPVTIIFQNSDLSPIADKTIWIQPNRNRSLNKRFSQKTDPDGKISFTIEPDTLKKSGRNIEISINENNLKYRRTFYPPEFNEDFDVQFFPESGILLSGCMQQVALKAIGSDGLSVHVSGKIYSGKDEFITDFSSQNYGMGKFVFTPDVSTDYYAVVKSENGTEKRINLPKAQSEGISIHLISRRDRIFYEVKNQTSQPNQSLYLLVHVRGMAYVVQNLANSLSGQIPESLLPSGEASFSVIDTLGNTWCERLFFRNANTFPKLTLESDKTEYGGREPVELTVSLHSPEGKPAEGNFSVSVTDIHTVIQDTLSDHILSYLLLSSDIKGFVEAPASYFSGDLLACREKQDLLMLTQGWRRFNTADVVKGKIELPTHVMEVSQILTGKVVNLFDKPAKNCDIILYSDYKNLLRTTHPDSLGRYYFDGLEFPDSTHFLLKADKKKSIADVKITSDSAIFNKPNCFIPLPRDKKEVAPQEYFFQSKEKYYYEGGVRIYNLDEVTINAEKKKQAIQTNYFSGAESAKLSKNQIDRFPNENVMNLIAKLPGVTVNGPRIRIRNMGQALLLVDGIVADYEFFKNFTARDIEEISVFKDSNASIFGMRGANGAISITLKRGGGSSDQITPVNMLHIRPFGYTKPAEFYVPKYDVDSIRNNPQPDYRTTIYWNPDIKTDSTGVAHLRFFTADKHSNYAVVIEGLSKTGEICRYKGILKRNEN